MAENKIISYDVELLSTNKRREFYIPEVYTNDLYTNEFRFNIVDMTAAELSGATATVLLNMKDGSFFNNADVTRSGNTFKYVLKENEGNHFGVAEVQLVVKISGKDYATPLYKFAVMQGLDDRKANEVVINDLNSETRKEIAKLKTETNAVISDLSSQFQQVIDETTGKDIVSAPEIIAARGSYDNLSERLLSADKNVDEKIKDLKLTSLSVPLARISNVDSKNNYIGVLPIVFKDGFLYGFRDNTIIVRSDNDGKTWEDVATSPVGSLHSIFWTNDGEVLLGFNGSLQKSTGWAKNPQTATWRTVVSKSKGVGILPWGIDGDGEKFIVTEYSGSDRSESRYVWISTDMGETFNIVIDKYAIDPTNKSHMHGVAYDKWADLFFLSHGHGDIEGVYWSDNNGGTWNLVEADFELDASPTTLTVTDNGVVAGSDSGRAGLYGIQRTKNPHNMIMRRTARWNVPREGVTGFAYRGIRDEDTGQVYVAFKSDFNDISPVIMAGSATTGSIIWEREDGKKQPFQFLAVTKHKVFAVLGVNNDFSSIIGDKPLSSVSNFDSGNIKTGKASSTSIGIGRNVDVQTANEIVIGNNAKQVHGSGGKNVIIGENAIGSSVGVTIGLDAESVGGYSTALGPSSKSKGFESTAIGFNAETTTGATQSVAIGSYSKAEFIGVAIGKYSNVRGPNGTAIGNNASSGTSSIALGNNASAGTKQVAIGENAKSIYSNSVALGNESVTTGENQLKIGERHIELDVAKTQSAGPVGVARLYLKEGSDGKQQLCVRFRNAEVVLATQP